MARDPDRASPDGKDRSSWPIRRFKLGEEPPEDLSDVTTPAERIAMMWPLALEAWRLAGKPIPDFRWEDAPTRVFRGCFPPDDE